jgi:hypothetical protein
MILLLLLAGAHASSTPGHRATWINVWLNNNQKYVPDPVTGRASNNVTCAWDVACAKYNVSLPPNMTLANTAAIDWTGGANYGNMYAYLGLIQRAGMDTVIPDFTNGFGMANSKFPVEQLHLMVRTYYPTMRIAYAVSSAAFPSALKYLDGASKSDTFGYLTDQADKPVFVLYTGYDQYTQIKQAHPSLRVLFADGESTAANKAGWHKPPYGGYGGVGSSAGAQSAIGFDANEVFWVAPSLDWQPGPTMNASWSISLPWLSWGLHALDALPARPWLTVVGSFDDSGERNMWMPALTSQATSKGDANRRDNSMLSLDGVPDSGAASVADGRWTVFYDAVTAFFTRGALPRGRASAVAARVPSGVGEFMLGGGGGGTPQRAETAYTLYVNPPFPFNSGVGGHGSAARPAFVRTVSTVYPPGMLFPPAAATGRGALLSRQWHGGGSAGTSSSPLLQQFSFQTGERATRPIAPLHVLACAACGLAVCATDYALNFLPATFLTSSGTLVLPDDLPSVDYPAAVDAGDCDVLRGPGVAFVTGSSKLNSSAGGSAGGSSAGVGIVAVPLTYASQSAVYSVPQPDGRVILYALATGEVFAATADFTGVELRRVRGAQRHLWTVAAHPASAGASVVSIADGSGSGSALVWQAAVGGAPAACAQQDTEDCLYSIRLVPMSQPSSLLSAFAFRDA